MLKIGSHVSFKKDTQLLGSLNESLSYQSTCFMFYTGAPQNTKRCLLDSKLTVFAQEKMQELGIGLDDIVVHAPYIINLANDCNSEQYQFAIRFLKDECQRCEQLHIKKLILHPGSHVGLGVEHGIEAIAQALNEVLETTSTIILLETMAGKGSEIGSRLEELQQIIEKITKQEQIGICLDTCHLWDSGYDLTKLDDFLQRLKEINLLSKIGCIHVNDSKNSLGSHKDRHENLGFGTIGFEPLLNIIYHDLFQEIPKILETPWVEKYPPYFYEIQEIKNKNYNPFLKEEIKKINLKH